jgi:hypothetical protein
MQELHQFAKLDQTSWATTRLHAGGAMTCGYKRRESNYFLALAGLPAKWREDRLGQGGHDNASYAPVAVNYASTGIKPVVGSLSKIHSESPTKTPE